MSWIKQLRDEFQASSGAPLHQQAGPPPIPPRPDGWTSDTQTRHTPDNPLLFQAFEWHTKSDPPKPDETHSYGSHWSRLARLLPRLNELGVTSVWLPPGCKANNPDGNGYDCYDLWDLGEFDQKWTRATRWGSREELRDLVETASRLRGPNGYGGVELVWDTVLNHKTAGDAVEQTWAVEVDGHDRRVEICAPKKIEAWLKYDFPGREREGMKYSPLKWRAEHFSGTDWDQSAHRNAIYKLIDDPASCPRPNEEQLPMPSRPNNGFNRFARFAKDAVKNALQDGPPARRPGKGWLEDVDTTHGNYDYLLFSNIYYHHPEVRHDILQWGNWMVEEVGISGFRLDAAQHFSWHFTREWIARVHAASRKRFGKDAIVIGEVLAGEVSRQLRWLDTVTPPGCGMQPAYAFDAPLLYSFSRVSEDVRRGSKNADLRTLLSVPGDPDKQALVAVRPQQAVTFVTSHDTQTGQASFVPMDQGLKAHFYAFILLRAGGLPYVFWGDLYGVCEGKKGERAEGPGCQIPSEDGSCYSRSVLPSLMLARKLFAYGGQTDYMDSQSCIGWTRSGTHDRPGCVVIMSISKPDKWTIKKMAAGRPGEKWIDILSEPEGRPEIVIDEEGCGVFACRGRTVSVYVREDCLFMARFPVEFDHDVYQQ
ncbi:putative glycosyl hydrolase, family 13, catalytic domain, glycosyl hydrolase, all-beta [Septoria linicola]|nr:putative glycosyl hydrolase, family 13, catalytic domain, glycosyl hydrolase, all-beta [Septoria linicola]